MSLPGATPCLDRVPRCCGRMRLAYASSCMTSFSRFVLLMPPSIASCARHKPCASSMGKRRDDHGNNGRTQGHPDERDTHPTRPAIRTSGRPILRCRICLADRMTTLVHSHPCGLYELVLYVFFGCQDQGSPQRWPSFILLDVHFICKFRADTRANWTNRCDRTPGQIWPPFMRLRESALERWWVAQRDALALTLQR